MELFGIAVLVALIAVFETRHKGLKQRHDDALSGLSGECNKLSRRGLRKRA